MLSKLELADAIERILADIKPRSLLSENDSATTLVLTAEGSFLADDLYRYTTWRKIDPAQEQ